MTALILSAAAWVPSKPELSVLKQQALFHWIIYAEVSVTTAEGEPVSKLPKSSFTPHIMFADGLGHHPGFTVSDGSSGWNAPGFYLLRFSPHGYDAEIRPAAFGVAITKKDRHTVTKGQVVVPIALAWKTEVEI